MIHITLPSYVAAVPLSYACMCIGILYRLSGLHAELGTRGWQNEIFQNLGGAMV